jgi:hypothetical protein
MKNLEERRREIGERNGSIAAIQDACEFTIFFFRAGLGRRFVEDRSFHVVSLLYCSFCLSFGTVRRQTTNPCSIQHILGRSRHTALNTGLTTSQICVRNAFGFRSTVRFWSSWKSDYSWRLQRKRADGGGRLSLQSVLCSPIWRARIGENGQNSRILRETKARILCSSDCVAEGETFELSVQLVEP